MERKKIIETINLEKTYGIGDNEVKAVDSISITIYEGEFVAIMGPSGSGKSTLMNILACLDKPTSGQYILNGEDVSNLNRTELARIRGKELGFVFQSFNLLPRMTALENVMLPLMYRPDRPTTIPQRKEMAKKVLESVGLGDRADHLPSELSGGQQQRVAIARVLVNEPILILADEPTGNLDTRSSEEIMEMLHDLHDRGRTIVMVTHEPDVAAHTERILHIRDGKLYADEKNGHLHPNKIKQAINSEPQKV
jgi:putative ABC transport system ATP-binding protein